MSRERVSINNWLRASESFIQEHDNYSQSEQTLLQAMLNRLSDKVSKAKETEDQS